VMLTENMGMCLLLMFTSIIIFEFAKQQIVQKA
jgi:hypothetical protein